MIKKYVFLGLLFAIHLKLTVYSQKAIDNLTAWSQVNPIEKVYLHTDRESYFAGGTIWFKAYFQDGYVSSAKSTTLFVELLGNNSKVLLRSTFPAYMSVSAGQLVLPDNIVSGSYQLRAYSPLMLNQDGFFYSKRITIFGKENQLQQQKVPKNIDLSFFSEGGNLITGLLNNIAFKAVDENGLPITITGEIRNDKNEIITGISSYHDGMGSFVIVPLEGETYYAITTFFGETKKYPLPVSTKNGIVFSIRNSALGKDFKIDQLKGNETFKAAYIVGQMQNNIVFRQDLKTDKTFFGGAFQTGELYSGILHVTVFNEEGMPLAERLTFVDNKEYILPADLKTDTLNTGERKRNRFSIKLKDTVVGNFSVSITDADYEDNTARPQNIFSSLLLNSDLKGYVHNPAWYFTNNDSAKQALDLVMMTNGWTRFKWTDAINNTLPKPLYKDPGYINFSGRVNIEGTRKPFADKDLMVWFTPVDTTRRGVMQLMHTDSLGRFNMDSVIFYGQTRILFSDVRGKKSKFIRIKMDADSLNKNYSLQPLQIPYRNVFAGDLEEKMTSAYSDYLKAEGLMLANVTVKARAKSSVQQLEEKYASGLFSGGSNAKVLDLRDENPTGADIFQYLQGRIAGLMISRDAEGYSLTYRQGGLSSGNVSLFLDEMPTDASFIESIPVNQIAYVKLFSNFIGASGNSATLAIYMKKGAELNAVMEAATDIINYNGYSVIKEFYHPNYAIRKPEDAKADNRLTLSWMPYINLASVNPTIPIVFYNNDRTKRFKIVAEGLTNDGKMLMIEKIIEPAK